MIPGIPGIPGIPRISEIPRILGIPGIPVLHSASCFLLSNNGQTKQHGVTPTLSIQCVFES